MATLTGTNRSKGGLAVAVGTDEAYGVDFITFSGATLTNNGNGRITLTISGGGGGGIGGTITAEQVAYGTGVDTIGGDGNFTWDSTNELLSVTYGKMQNIYQVFADVDISKGEAVYITGFNGGSGKPTVALAQANNSATMPSIGLATANITAGQQGFVIYSGQLNGVTTPGTENDTLYVSATTAGALTNVKPTGATELIQNVGRVVEAGANGKIAVSNIGRTNDVPNSFNADSITLTNPLAVADGGTGAGTAAGARTNLGLGDMATQNSTAVTIAGGSIKAYTFFPATFPPFIAGSNVNIGDAFSGDVFFGTPDAVDPVTFNLATVTSAGFQITIVNIGTGQPVIITCDAATQTINGATANIQITTQYNAVSIVTYDGANFVAIGI